MTLQKALVACLAAALVFPALALQVSAASPAQTEAAPSEIGFYVQAVIPENQVKGQNSYFDLRMAPEQKQTLEVVVVNQNKHEITILVSAVSTSTNPNGVLDYRTPGIADETLHIPFSDIATVQNNELLIPAHSSSIAHVQVNMPKTLYDGAILGGIVLEKKSEWPATHTRSEDCSPSSSGGAVITNTYSYSIAVKLTETDAVVPPDFEMTGIQVSGEYGRILAIHKLRNPRPVIIKDMEMDVDIYRQGKDVPVAQFSKTGLDMAPNSVMEMGVPPLENRLEAGTYTSFVEVRYGNDTWNFETTFVVDAAEARSLNNMNAPVKEPFPLWAVVLILLAAVIVVLLAVLLAVLLRRQKATHRARAANRAHSKFPHRHQRSKPIYSHEKTKTY